VARALGVVVIEIGTEGVVVCLREKVEVKVRVVDRVPFAELLKLC